MADRSEEREGKGRLNVGRLLLRALIVTGLAVVFALLILVRPLHEPSPSPAPSGSQGVTSDEMGPTALEAETEPTATEASQITGAEASPTPSPVPSTRPTETPTSTTAPSPTPTPTPTATSPPVPTATPTPDTAPSTATARLESRALAGRVEQGSYHSRLTGGQESYRIYLPPDYDQEDRRYPVLYLLHGWPYDETHWDILGVDEVADARIVDGELQPFIIVLPGADADGLYVTTSGGSGSFEEQLVNELMPHIDATFRSVQTRDARAIGGISRGGVWALEIAFRHPDAFGIVGAHSPALSANRAPSAFDPFTLMREPGVEGLRIYLSAGDADWARQATQQLHQALNDQGIANRFVVHPGVHVDQLWSQHVDEYLSFYTAGW